MQAFDVVSDKIKRHLERKQVTYPLDYYLNEILPQGGKPFVENLMKYGCTEKGDRLRMPLWFQEYAELLGDFRVSHTLTFGCSQLGKAQPLDAKVLTPTGWRLMGELAAGDSVIAGDGTATTVIQVFPQGVKDIYKVILDDGSSTECCNDHLWLTQTNDDRRRKVKNLELQPGATRQRDWEPMPDRSRPGKVKTLKEIRETLNVAKANGDLKLSRIGSTVSNHSLPVVKPIQFTKSELPINPYLLGILLGDGYLRTDSICFSTIDPEIVQSVSEMIGSGLSVRHLSRCDYRITSDLRGYHLRRGCHTLMESLNQMGLTGKKSHQKFIPDDYMTASIEDRVALLQGLMDTDGTIANAKSASLSYCSGSFLLISQLRDLVLSLGGLVNPIRSRYPSYTYNGEKRIGAISYNINFRLPNEIEPFKLKRKLKLCRHHDLRKHHRYIKDIAYVGKKEAQCILIDHPSHLYVTDDYIVTHNTLAHTLLNVNTLCTTGLNTVWFYASRESRDGNCAEQFIPAALHWIANVEREKGIQLRSDRDRNLTSRFQIGGATAIFSYTSTSKTSPQRAGVAAVGGAAASVTGNVLFLEERSQMLPGTADPLPRRLDAGKIPTRPIRELGTPGGGLGIEQGLDECRHQFYPHVTCPNCQSLIKLNPKGCLLKQVKGKYLSESGRPVEWHCKDSSNRIDSAYIACYKCNSELTKLAIEQARYYCLNTGVSLRDYLDSLPTDRIAISALRHKVAISISPLLRDVPYNLAAQIIRDGLTCVSTNDWQQQGLGLPSENLSTGITKEKIRDAIEASRPEGSPDFVLAGIDQGRAEDWLVVTEYYLPKDSSLTPIEQANQTIRKIVFASDINRSEIGNYLMKYGVQFGLADSEPDRTSMLKIADRTCLALADQKTTLLDAVKEAVVKDGGNEYPCWFIRNNRFQDEVLNIFLNVAWDGEICARLPRSWKEHLNSQFNYKSPVLHLTAPSIDVQTMKWVRGKNNIDDLFYAMVFCEAAFYIQLNQYLEGLRRPSLAWLNNL